MDKTRGVLGMPDRLPVLKVNSDIQHSEFLRFVFWHKTVHVHRTCRISVDIRVSFLIKRFLMKGRGVYLLAMDQPGGHRPPWSNAWPSREGRRGERPSTRLTTNEGY